ncbi:MAG: ABC transporter ATP-binding protein [Candidatus Limnocylindrales bacterium]
MSRIEIHDLTVAYPQARSDSPLVALWQVDLEVGDREFLTIVGPSGCGKTTLLNCIAGLVTPTVGQVLVGNHPVRGPGPDRAVVFQDYALLPWRCVWDNVRFGLEMQPRLKSGADGRIQAAVDLVGLHGFEKAYPRELSGGMRQRVGLARAIVAEPSCLLMDEPFAAVDAMTREVMQGELEKIVAESKASAVFITHSIDEAILLGDRVVVATARPGRIKAIVDVPLPRPRAAYDAKADPVFIRLREEIWNMLRDEAVEHAHRTAAES